MNAITETLEIKKIMAEAGLPFTRKMWNKWIGEVTRMIEDGSIYQFKSELRGIVSPGVVYDEVVSQMAAMVILIRKTVLGRNALKYEDEAHFDEDDQELREFYRGDLRVTAEDFAKEEDPAYAQDVFRRIMLKFAGLMDYDPYLAVAFDQLLKTA